MKRFSRRTRFTRFLTALFVALALTSVLNADFVVSAYGERATPEEDAIERYRKGDAILSVVDDQGRPVIGASVNYRQLTRDFLFGVGGNPFDEGTWLLLREAGINYAQMYTTWNITGNPGGRAWIENGISTAHRMGLVLAGHCLVWMVGSYPGIPGADPWNLPTSVKNLTYDELKKQLYDHVYETVNRYKTFVSYWDINEPFWAYADPFHLNSKQWIEIVNLTVQAIRQADPEAKIYINNLLGDYAPWDYHPVSHMKLLLGQGSAFDVIGLEMYGEDRTPGVPLDGKQYPVISWASRRLDQFGKLGKPIILTEVAVTTVPNEKAQAEWLKDAYTMAFGKPYVRGITWAYPFDDPFLPGEGMFDCQRWGSDNICHQATARQAYYALKNLTSSWLTEGSGKTDTEGRARFRGFAGNYSVTVKAEGFEALETTIYVQEQVENQFEIRGFHTKTATATITATEGRRTIALTSTATLSTVTPSYALALSQQQIYVVAAGVFVACLASYLAVKKRKRT